MDLLVRRARLLDQPDLVDVAVQGERIAEIGPDLPAAAETAIDADGRLVAPTFVEPHIHLDKALIAESIPPNRSGTLAEAIALTWERKRAYTVEDVADRACRVLEWAVLHGATIVRTHVDVDTIGGLVPLRGLLEARRRMADLCDVQIVAFPQEGILRDPGAEDLLRRAMAEGADVVGGMPHNELTPADSVRHIEIAFAIAREFDADVDMHVDETDDPSSRTLQELAAATIRHGWQGRVTAGHTCALAAYDDPYAARVIAMVRAAGVHMVANACTNLMLQGRFDRQPIRRGVTRVRELLDAGVNVVYGQDCVKDPFYPTLGQADPLETGFVTAHAVQFTKPEHMETLLGMATTGPAGMLRLRDYGLRPGAVASFNVIDAPSAAEAYRTRADRLHVVRRGRVVARTKTARELLRG